MKICNCTNHKMTPGQISAGCITPVNQQLINDLISFQNPEELSEMEQRADALSRYVKDNGYDAALIGGAPYFQPYLEEALFQYGLKAVYAFSQRVSEERMKENGEVEKVSVFKSNTLLLKNPDRSIELITM